MATVDSPKLSSTTTTQKFVAPDFKRRQLLFDSFTKLGGPIIHSASSSSHSTGQRSVSDSTVGRGGGEDANPRGTLLYTWGAGYHGQLGLNTFRKKCRMTPACLDFKEPVLIVACGGFHTCILTDDGRVYTWGDGRYGQLGNLQRKHNMHSTPHIVDAFVTHKIPIMQIACGQYHTAAVSSQGKLYTWGSGKWGQLGHGLRLDERFPRKVEGDKTSGHMSNITKVACGDRHTACINEEGKVITFGSGQHGQLGQGNGLDQLKPIMITTGELVGQVVVSIECGATVTAAVTDTGLLYVWGFGESIHPKGTSNIVDAPRLVDFKHEKGGAGPAAAAAGASASALDKNNPHSINAPLASSAAAAPAVKVKSVACGQAHILVLTETGDVYAFGMGAMGQIGHGSKNNVRNPRLILRGKEIYQIAAGRYHSMAVSAYGILYSWGCGESGQLGHNSLDIELFPKIVEYILPNVVGQISCGEHHSIALTSIAHSHVSGDVLNWKLIEDEELRLKRAMLSDIPNGLKSKHVLQLEQERKGIIRSLAESLRKEREENAAHAQYQMALIKRPDEVVLDVKEKQKEKLLQGDQDTLNIINSYTDAAQKFMLSNDIHQQIKHEQDEVQLYQAQQQQQQTQQPLLLAADDHAHTHAYSSSVVHDATLLGPAGPPRQLLLAEERDYQPPASALLSPSHHESQHGGHSDEEEEEDYRSLGGAGAGKRKTMLKRGTTSGLAMSASAASLPAAGVDGRSPSPSTRVVGGNPALAASAAGGAAAPRTLTRQNVQAQSSPDILLGASGAEEKSPTRTAAAAAAGGHARPATTALLTPSGRRHQQLAPLATSAAARPVSAQTALVAHPTATAAHTRGLSHSQSEKRFRSAAGGGGGAGELSSTALVPLSHAHTALLPLNCGGGAAAATGFQPLVPRMQFAEQTVKALSLVKGIVSKKGDEEEQQTHNVLKLQKKFNELTAAKAALEDKIAHMQSLMRLTQPSHEEAEQEKVYAEQIRQLNMKLVTLNTRLMEAEENKKNYELYIIRMKEEDLQLSKQIEHLRQLVTEYDRLLSKVEKMSTRVLSQRGEIHEELSKFTGEIATFTAFADFTVNEYKKILDRSNRQHELLEKQAQQQHLHQHHHHQQHQHQHHHLLEEEKTNAAATSDALTTTTTSSAKKAKKKAGASTSATNTPLKSKDASAAGTGGETAVVAVGSSETAAAAGAGASAAELQHAASNWEEKVEYYEQRYKKLCFSTGLTHTEQIIAKHYFNSEISQDLKAEIGAKQDVILSLQSTLSTLENELDSMSATHEESRWREVQELEDRNIATLNGLSKAKHAAELWDQKVTLVQEGLLQLARNVEKVLAKERNLPPPSYSSSYVKTANLSLLPLPPMTPPHASANASTTSLAKLDGMSQVTEETEQDVVAEHGHGSHGHGHGDETEDGHGGGKGYTDEEWEERYNEKRLDLILPQPEAAMHSDNLQQEVMKQLESLQTLVEETAAWAAARKQWKEQYDQSQGNARKKTSEEERADKTTHLAKLFVAPSKDSAVMQSIRDMEEREKLQRQASSSASASAAASPTDATTVHNPHKLNSVDEVLAASQMQAEYGQPAQTEDAPAYA